MAKTASTLPKELLEQIYAEVETRVERKFKQRIEQLENESETWRKKYFSEQAKNRKLEGELGLAKQEINSLKEIIEKQNVRIAGLEKIIHGPTTESGPAPNTPDDEPESKRARGRQPGSKGHGRKSRSSLEPEDCNHDIPADEQFCKLCGEPYEDMGFKTS